MSIINHVILISPCEHDASLVGLVILGTGIILWGNNLTWRSTS